MNVATLPKLYIQITLKDLISPEVFSLLFVYSL
jgi:hypothetical protein